jgi:general stress protein 26
MTTLQSAEEQQHLIDVFKQFHTAVLVTRRASGELHGRPMALAEVRPGGSVYFATSLANDVVEEVDAEPRVAVTVQGMTKYASISGRARVERDRSLIHELWQETWRVWFPKGKDDPDLCLIGFRPTEGEYWDTAALHGVKLAVRATKAYFAGESLNPRDREVHAKVRLD